MLAWKSWFDLRLRFFCSLTVVLILLAVNIGIYPYLNALNPSDSLSQQTLKRILQDYPYYLDSQWFATNAPISLYIITILLALGGILSEKRKGAFLMTLSFPVERRNWVMTHAGMTALLTFILALTSLVGTVFGSLFIGKLYPAETAFARVVGIWLACFPLIGLSLALNSLFHSSIKSAMILMPIYLMGPQMTGFITPGFYQWCPWQLADTTFMRHNHVNWRALLVSVLIGVGCTLVAAYRFKREES